MEQGLMTGTSTSGGRKWNRRLRHLLVFAFGVALWVFVGMSEFAWKHTDRVLIYVCRPLAAVSVVALFWFYLRGWRRTHGIGVTPDRQVFDSELAEMTPDELLASVDELAPDFAELSVDDAKMVVDHLVTPEKYRRKVIEDITLATQQTFHDITFLWRKHSHLQIDGANVFPFMRPKKRDVPREVQIDGGRLVGAFETLALLHTVCSRLGHLPGRNEDGANPLTETARQAVLNLIAAPPLPDITDNQLQAIRTAAEDAIRSVQNPHAPPPEPELEVLLDLLLKRRPYFARVYDPAVAASTTTQISYRSGLLRPGRTPDYDRWRKRKDSLRNWLRLPPRLVYISLERARSADSYQLAVHCDEHLFVDEANVLVEPSMVWLKPLPRQRNYKAYIGWEEPTGKAFTSLGAAKLGSTERLESFWYVLRLTEKPPGTLATASSVAFATLVAIWLVGATGARSTGGADLVAFVLALPAVASTAFGLVSTGANHGLRSFTGVLSLIVSLLLSMGTTILYLSEHQASHAIRQEIIEHGHQFYYLSDYLWVAVFCVATLNFAWATGTLLLRVRRYGDLLRTQRVV
jgi:hypothetical protein